jgi:hypothetical protein
MPNTRFVKKCYLMMYNDDVNGHINWVSSLRQCLQIHGFGNVWANQSINSEQLFLKHFVQRLKDMFLQDWHEAVNSNRKLSWYILFKKEFTYEYYLDMLDIKKFRFAFVNFRVGSHELEIETGRHRNISRQNRLCKACNKNAIEDEYHFWID